MKTLFSLLILAVVLHAIPSAVASETNTASTTSSVLRVGMSFDRAKLMLTNHGAKECPFQIMSKTKDEKEIRYYSIKGHPDIKIIAAKDGPDLKVESISVQTYKPQSWDSKTDKERSKFFQSFQAVTEYDIDKVPNQASATSKPAPSAGSSSHQR